MFLCKQYVTGRCNVVGFVVNGGCVRLNNVSIYSELCKKPFSLVYVTVKKNI